jgi:hypothetical protein
VGAGRPTRPSPASSTSRRIGSTTSRSASPKRGSMCRWYSLTSFSVVPRGIARKLGSPHQGSRRSRSWSKGRSSLRATPAVETSATVQSRSGFASGVKGMTPGSCRAAQAFMICRDAKSRKRYESIAIKPTSTSRGLFAATQLLAGVRHSVFPTPKIGLPLSKTGGVFDMSQTNLRARIRGSLDEAARHTVSYSWMAVDGALLSGLSGNCMLE